MKRILLIILYITLTLLIYLLFNTFISILFAFLAIGIYFSNRLLKKYIRDANYENIKYMVDSRRNFDAIVIGQPLTGEGVKKVKGTSILSFTRHNRTLFASYLFLIHQYSYLREDGKGIIYIVSSSNDATEKEMYVTIIDAWSFHPVIKKRLNVTWALRYPLFSYWKKFYAKNFFVDKGKMPLQNRIILFCKERGIKVEFIDI